MRLTLRLEADISDVLCDVIRAARVDGKHKTQDICDHLGCSQATYYSIEQRGNTINVDYIYKLIDYLGIETSAIPGIPTDLGKWQVVKPSKVKPKTKEFRAKTAAALAS